MFCCESIEKVSDDFIKRNKIPDGDYDNISGCRYDIPTYWEIGAVFERLIEDNYEESDVYKAIREVYASWLADRIFDFNSDLYYQSREYLALCYSENEIIE